MILNWWDLQQLSTTRHFFQAQTVICFPGPRFHDSKPSIHIIPGFLLDLCFCVQDLIVEMLYSHQQSKENNLFIKWSQDAFNVCSGENLPWNSMSFCLAQPRLQPFFDGRSSFQPEVWIPSESMCKSNQLILSEILTSSFRSYIGKIQRHLYKQDWNKIQ